MPDHPDLQVTVDEVVERLDPLGRALWDRAQLQVLVEKQAKRIAELENTANTPPGSS